MGAHPLGPDYGVFEFGDLFSEALLRDSIASCRPGSARTWRPGSSTR